MSEYPHLGPIVSLWRYEIWPPMRSMKDILDAVSEQTGVSVGAIKSPLRYKHISRARHQFCWEAYQVRYRDGTRRYSLPMIGQFLGGRDHTTILSSVRRWQQIMDRERDVDPGVLVAAE